MTQPFYPEHPSADRRSSPATLPRPALVGMRHPAGYIRDDALADAVNVALLLMQPLLLTGPPGTGKSELAASIAWELGLDDPLVFETKSISQARDLFYVYDTLGRFTARQLGDAKEQLHPARDYLTFSALGEAIVRSREKLELADILPTDYAHPGKRRSVVLIDEIEKAPRDLPNDLLNEIERMYFRIPELGNVKIEADPDLRPVVVVTSNSESSLPDAFLRRCVYYNIPFPDRDTLERIVLSRFASANELTPMMAEAVDFLLRLQEPEVALDKRPGTAELLNWLTALRGFGIKESLPLRGQPGAQRALTTLAKLATDQERVTEEFEAWLVRGAKAAKAA
jgi:MoxR-like ATPase